MASLPSIENLRCFLEAARALNFRKAARAVALTPTAFGARLKQLEDQVGAQLFVRTTRSVSLTETGLSLVPLAARTAGMSYEELCAHLVEGAAARGAEQGGKR